MISFYNFITSSLMGKTFLMANLSCETNSISLKRSCCKAMQTGKDFESAKSIYVTLELTNI